MNKNNYNLLSGIKLRLIAFAVSLLPALVYSQATYTLNHTGAMQTVTLQAGVYDVKMWGADGGNSNNSRAGIGGYSNGTLTLGSTTTVYIGVGGSPVYTGATGLQPGGFNGGGSGYANATGRAGGGATHMATAPGTLGALASNTPAVIMVAGGGGGDQNSGLIGHGGGLTGGGTYPGTQTGSAGGIFGAFGQGGDITTSYGGGGGGGWYGGGGNQLNAGSGGSGYIGGVTNGITTMSAQTGFVTKPITGGHGLVIITELCSISLYAVGNTNSLSPVICAGQSVTLTTDAISNYSWSTGATTSSIVVAPGTTSVYALTATSPSNCTSSRSITVAVNPGLPVLSINNTNSNACIGGSVTLTASGAITYTWANPGVINGQPFAPTSSALYSVTGENACGTSTAQTTVSVHPLPTITTVVSTPSICSGQTVSFNAVGNATSYVWTPNYTSGTPLYLQTNTTYTVVGTSAFGCTVMSTAFASVVTTPMSQPLSNPPLICIGSSATLTAPGASSYTWTTPSGTLGTPQIIVSPAVTTTYTVAKSNANCVDVQTVQVIVNGLPTVQVVAAPPVVCAGKPSVLSGGGAGSFTWTAPGFTTTGSNPTVTPINSTTYMVAGSDGTCIGTASVQVLTNPNPVISIVPTSSTICRGDSVTMNANGALTYTWTTSSGTLSAYPTGTAISQSIEDKPTLTTLYTITGVNQHTCFTTVTQVVVVNPTPTLNVQTTKPLVCTNSVSTLTVTGANTYTWDNVNAGGVTTSVNAVTPISTTIYSVTGFYTSTGCNSTKTIQVTVFEPNFTVNSPTSSCQGGTINLIASGASSYVWHTVPPQPFSQISVSPSTPTMYLVTAISNSNGVNCPSTKTVDVTIYANPTITAATSKTLVCKGEPAFLAGGGGVSYQWTPAGGSGDTVKVNPNNHTTYTVVGTDQNGCTGTASVQVKVQTCFGIEELSTTLVGFKMYPNPAHQVISVFAPVDISLTLSNQLGQAIRTIQVDGNSAKQLDVSDLSSGIYFITGEKDGSVVKEKLVITR